MLVSTETCNNGTSVLVLVAEWPQLPSLVLMILLTVILFHKKKSVSFFILNVIMKDTMLESVKILHLLISTLKFNLSLSQKELPSIFTTYHVSMD